MARWRSISARAWASSGAEAPCALASGWAFAWSWSCAWAAAARKTAARIKETERNGARVMRNPEELCKRRKGPRRSLQADGVFRDGDRKSTRLNSSHSQISYAVFCLKKKKETIRRHSHTQ